MRHELVSNTNDSPAPRVSVVVNVWGGDEPASLKRSLSSISSQRHRPDEVVVVVDGPISTEIEEEIQRFRNEATFPAKTIYIQSPKGLWNARNVGIGEAEHEIVALHDADDVMHPERLRLQLNELRHNSIDVLCTPAWEFDTESGQITNLRMCSEEIINIHVMFWNNSINHSSVMARKDALIKIGGYRNLHLSEDYDLWLRLLIAGKSIRQSRFVLQALGVNSTFLARRGGSKFFRSEKVLHRLFQQTTTFSTVKLWVRLIARMSYRLGPAILRKAHQGIKTEKFFAMKPLELFEYLRNDPLDIQADLK